MYAQQLGVTTNRLHGRRSGGDEIAYPTWGDTVPFLLLVNVEVTPSLASWSQEGKAHPLTYLVYPIHSL